MLAGEIKNRQHILTGEIKNCIIFLAIDHRIQVYTAAQLWIDYTISIYSWHIWLHYLYIQLAQLITLSVYTAGTPDSN